MSADSGTKTNQTAMTTQPASRMLGRLTSAANRPAAARPAARLDVRWRCSLSVPVVGEPSSPPPEQLVELPLPSALFLRRHQHRDDLPLRQHFDDAWRIRLHVLARR